MNFRITTLLFALLLGALWAFGLMIAHKKLAGDPTLIMPTLADAKINRVTVKIKDKDVDLEFKQKGDFWYHVQGGLQAKVEGFRIEQNIIKTIQNSRNDETTADLDKPVDHYGLDKPQMTITLFGKGKDQDADGKWEFHIGKTSADLIYVQSSDRGAKIFAVPAKNLDNAMVRDARYLRSKRIFEFVEPSVKTIQVKARDRLELKRGDGNTWQFVDPPYGFAGFDTEVDEKKTPFAKDAEAISSVKALLGAIINVRVEEDDDFEPLGELRVEYGLEKGKERLKIEIGSSEKKDKESPSELLLIGARVGGKKALVKGPDFYYARLEGDDGVMKISAKWLDPIEEALRNPGKLRSLDVAAFDAKQVDHVLITTLDKDKKKEEFKFFKEESKKEPNPFDFHKKEFDTSEWQLYVGAEKKPQKASPTAMRALLDQLLGKKAIVEFLPTDDLKKREADWGLADPSAILTVYQSAIEPEKKDDKADDKKDDKGEKKEEKKEEKKKDGPPSLKDKVKPAVTMAIGNLDKDHVYIRRTLELGDEDKKTPTHSYFTMKKEFVEKVLPTEGVLLAYSDLAMPRHPLEDAVELKIQRPSDKAPLELFRHYLGGEPAWYIKDAQDPAKPRLADADRAFRLVAMLTEQARAKKLIKKIDPKDDLDMFGLKTPAYAISATIKKQPMAPGNIAGLVAQLGHYTPLQALAIQAHADKGEVVTLELGSETTEEKDKPGVFARHSGSKLLMLVEREYVKSLKEADLRDRSGILRASPLLALLTKGCADDNPHGALMFASPQFTGAIHKLESDTVRKVRLDLRTHEFRSFQFGRGAKDKPWTDEASLVDFHPDDEKVSQFVKDFSKITTERFAAFTVQPKDTLSEFKLGDKEFTFKLDFETEITRDGKPVRETVTLTVGSSFENRGYFARSSAWPQTVFFLPPTMIAPVLQGAGQFAKERTAAN